MQDNEKSTNEAIYQVLVPMQGWRLVEIHALDQDAARAAVASGKGILVSQQLNPQPPSGVRQAPSFPDPLPETLRLRDVQGHTSVSLTWQPANFKLAQYASARLLDNATSFAPVQKPALIAEIATEFRLYLTRLLPSGAASRFEPVAVVFEEANILCALSRFCLFVAEATLRQASQELGFAP